jgi:hypothetical protein
MSKNLLTEVISEPLNGARTARIDIHAGDGNLTVDGLIGGDQLLASGELQYIDDQSIPARSLEVMDGRAVLTLKGGRDRRPRFRLPWSACNGATEWQIHLNPSVSSEIVAHSDGGNLRLDLAGFRLSSLSAGTGGGNVEVVLPESAADLQVTAVSGAGNVNVLVPSGAAVRVQATTGLGKAIVDPRFDKIGGNTYQSSGFDGAANKIEIFAKTGAGNVTVQVI